MGDSAGGGIAKKTRERKNVKKNLDLDFFDKENLSYDESKKDHDYGPNICKTNFSTPRVRRKCQKRI